MKIHQITDRSIEQFVEDLAEGTMGGLNRWPGGYDVSYEKVLDDPLKGNKHERWASLDEAPRNPRPGATQDEMYNGWKLRYQLRPRAGEREYKGIAWIERSQRIPPIEIVGISTEEVVKELKNRIDNSTGNQEITSNYVTVDFNVHLSGHKFRASH